MAVHAAWPPLACLAMFVMIVAFLIIKYGDRLCRARSIPKPQNFEIEDQSSTNTMSCMYEEKDSMRDFVDIMEIPEIMPQEIPEVIYESEKMEKYEYSV